MAPTTILLPLVMLPVIVSSGIHLDEHESRPEALLSIPESTWWSVVTITTVGDGDVPPTTAITPIGRLVAAVISIIGLLAIAIPTGIVGAGFSEEFTTRRGPKD